MTTNSSLMSGRVLLKVISDERAGKYDGDDVQVIPHLTAAIQKFIIQAGKGFDVHIVEIGGTVGDLESQSFLEAIRELGIRVGLQNCLYVHVVYMPYLGASQETKTKPAQNSVRDLRGLGITPNLLMARSEQPASPSIKKKLSLFCGVGEEAIALLPNASTIYEVPLTLEDAGIAKVICDRLDLPAERPKLTSWRAMVKKAKDDFDTRVRVGVVAKYMDNQDTYLSVFEALRAAGWKHNVGVDIQWIDAEALQDPHTAAAQIATVDGIVVPGGFGTRGLEGKIRAAQYALTHDVPYLGLCLGLQMAVTAAARNGGLQQATSAELDKDAAHAVIHTMADQKGKENTGGTMRLGDYPCVLQKGSLAATLYGTTQIVERHRHRYECNNEYRAQYEQWGIRPVGTSPDGRLVEVIEGISHPFFLASQFHPEFKSRPNRAHPMFAGFIQACLNVAK